MSEPAGDASFNTTSNTQSYLSGLLPDGEKKKVKHSLKKKKTHKGDFLVYSPSYKPS